MHELDVMVHDVKCHVVIQKTSFFFCSAFIVILIVINYIRLSYRERYHMNFTLHYIVLIIIIIFETLILLYVDMLFTGFDDCN